MAYLNTGTPSFDIPLDKYARSGLPKAHQENILSSLVPNLITAAKDYPELVSSGYDNLSNNPLMNRTMRGFKDATQGTFQGLLNKLANRGMMSSQTAADSISQMGTALNQQQFGGLADKAYAAEAEKLKALQAYPGILSQIVNLGQSTENPFQPYGAVLDLIKTMM